MNRSYIVDGTIHKAAGVYLIEENKTLGGCMNGEAKISGGYKLPAKCEKDIENILEFKILCSRHHLYSWPKRRKCGNPTACLHKLSQPDA